MYLGETLNLETHLDRRESRPVLCDITYKKKKKIQTTDEESFTV